MPFEVLTKSEAVERARISRRQLDYQIRAGAGPAVTRIGGAVRVRSDELQAWLERCTVRKRTRSPIPRSPASHAAWSIFGRKSTIPARARIDARGRDIRRWLS